jgi:hypothetical protein
VSVGGVGGRAGKEEHTPLACAAQTTCATADAT